MSTPPEVTVLVVENDAIVRLWVRLSLQGSEFRLAGDAETFAAGLALAERRRPGVLIVDYHLGDGLGTDLVRSLRKRGIGSPALLITASPERGLNEDARAAGIQGTILKSAEPADFLEAVRRVARGGETFDFRHPRRSVDETPLAHRERDVIRLAARGATNPEIARDLGVGSETVKTLLSRAYVKLGVSRRAEAVAEAQRRGLL